MSETKILATASSNEPIITRAFAAYWRAAAREGMHRDVPASDSYLAELDGKRYVVLHNVRGVLTVYRVRTSGILKELRRWPRALEQV